MPKFFLTLSSGERVPSTVIGEDRVVRAVIEELCPRWFPGILAYIGDVKDKCLHLDSAYLEGLGVVIAPAAKMPDIVVHDARRNWLVLIEAVSTAGPVDGKRRKELKELFQGCRAGLVFVTAFETRAAMQGFLSQISWETEVWIADNPDHLIHFNGERFLGPYPDVSWTSDTIPLPDRTP